MPKTAPKSCPSSVFDASDVISHASFCNTPGITLRNSPNSSAAVSSKLVPVERQVISVIGRPLAFEDGCPDYSSLSKPTHSKPLFRKPSQKNEEKRKTLMFSDRFYEGASQIKAMNLKKRPNKQQSILSHLNVDIANSKTAISWESLIAFEDNDPEFSVQGAIEQARSVSESWRQKKKNLVAGGMPTDKTGLLGEPAQLRNVIPPRLKPLKHSPIKSARPLKDEISTAGDEFDVHHASNEPDVHFLRAALTSSGLYPETEGVVEKSLSPSHFIKEGAPHPSLATEKCFDASLTQIETSAANSEASPPLGIFNSGSQDGHSVIKPEPRTWTPRHTKTPELPPSSSFSEPLKAILKGAYDRRAADAMFCQLYLNAHVKNFEKEKVAQIAAPESMHEVFIADNAALFDNSCFNVKNHSTNVQSDDARNLKVHLTRCLTPETAALIHPNADKMGRPPAKPNMARAQVQARKDAIKAYELANIPRHKKVDWSAFTPEEFKKKKNAELQQLIQSLNMPEGCWEVSSWFR